MSFEELNYEFQNFKMLVSKEKYATNQKIKDLSNKVNEQKSSLHGLQSHFKVMQTCINVYIDTMKELRVEYKNCILRLAEMKEQQQQLEQLIEQRSPDMVMVNTFQELHVQNLAKVKSLELKIETLEGDFNRIATPTQVFTNFHFDSTNNNFSLSPCFDSTTVSTGMSPLIL